MTCYTEDQMSTLLFTLIFGAFSKYFPVSKRSVLLVFWSFISSFEKCDHLVLPFVKTAHQQ